MSQGKITKYRTINVTILLDDIDRCNGCPLSHRRKTTSGKKYWFQCLMGYPLTIEGDVIVRPLACQTDNRTRIIGE